MNDREYICQYGGFRDQRPSAEEMSTLWARPGYAGAEALSTAPSRMYCNQNIDFAVGVQPSMLSSTPSLPMPHTQELAGHQQMLAALGLQAAASQAHDLAQSIVSELPPKEKSGSTSKIKTVKSKEKVKKKKGDPTQWKKAKNKIQREQGKEYVTASGKLKKAKAVQPVDCSKCRYHCNDKIPEDTRQQIHTLYWNLGSYERQRAFIAQHVTQNDVKNPKPTATGALGKREVSNSFFLTHDRREHRVCKAFFTKTLDIGNKLIDYTMKKTEAGVYVGRDERGRKYPANKTSPHDLDFVKMHIGSFGADKKEGKNKRRYLSPDLNVGKMYGMYKALCMEMGRKPVSLSLYRNVFKHDFNLAFAKPKREHCPNCNCESQRQKKVHAKESTSNTGTEIPHVSSSFSKF